MGHAARTMLEPRKTPAQARSAVTVDAISEATIQVLLSHGPDRLTTTRVAERAGVSVGTLYQYFPNKQSLLFAVLEDHLDKVSVAVETACERARGEPIAVMATAVTDAFVDAKMARTDISTALYRIAADVGGPALVERTGRRSREALATMLRSARDAVVHDEDFTIQMMFAAMAGATRSVLESGASPVTVGKLREHLALLCRSYLLAVAGPRPSGY
jgi:AcrR family transcriptional regulator